MNTVRLGKTGIVVSKNGFGALPIQRISKEDAVCLLHKAFDGGINFYDTARAYSDSEEKLGAAFSDRRNSIKIASKTMAVTTDWISISSIIPISVRSPKTEPDFMKLCWKRRKKE